MLGGHPHRVGRDRSDLMRGQVSACCNKVCVMIQRLRGTLICTELQLKSIFGLPLGAGYNPWKKGKQDLGNLRIHPPFPEGLQGGLPALLMRT